MVFPLKCTNSLCWVCDKSPDSATKMKVHDLAAFSM